MIMKRTPDIFEGELNAENGVETEERRGGYLHEIEGTIAKKITKTATGMLNFNLKT